MKSSRRSVLLLGASVLVVSLASSGGGPKAVMRDGTNAGLAGLEDPAERPPMTTGDSSAGGRAAARDIGAR